MNIATTAGEMCAILGPDGRVDICAGNDHVAHLTIWDAVAFAVQVLDVARAAALDTAREALDPVVLVDRLSTVLAGAGTAVPAGGRDIQLAAAAMLMATLGAPQPQFEQTVPYRPGPDVPVRLPPVQVPLPPASGRARPGGTTRRSARPDQTPFGEVMCGHCEGPRDDKGGFEHRPGCDHPALVRAAGVGITCPACGSATRDDNGALVHTQRCDPAHDGGRRTRAGKRKEGPAGL